MNADLAAGSPSYIPPVDLRRDMGRTVYGVDLEESPFGGLIEKLLTEEELEKLADGGAPGAHAAPDGGSDDGDADDTEGGDADDDWSVSDDTYEPSGDAESDDEADSVTGDADVQDESPPGSSGTSSWSPSPSSPPPSTARDDDSGGYGSGSGYGESTGFGSGAGLGDDGYEADEDAGFLSKHKWLLLKVAVVLAALAAVGVVVWRYKDRLAGLVPGRGGDGADEFDVDEPSAGTGDEDDVSPARRRAKAGEAAPDSDADDGGDERREAPPRQRSRRDEADVETPGRDLDLGALVGLGVLTLIAALVRKYDEERNRPHDPLVDGPLDEDDDVADDDQ
jgi:hypothetical protein